ncbi:MAG: hypothetical protein RL649_331 [Actinomycetota bacterium]
MRRIFLSGLITTWLLAGLLPGATAGLNAPINLDNPADKS